MKLDLNPQVFDRIQSRIGPCKIDLFASHQTIKFSAGCQTQRQRKQTHSTRTGRLPGDRPIPPGACCLSQIKQQNARVILFTQLWNTQPWFLGLAEDYPRLLPASKVLVLLLSNQEFLMKQGVPELVVWFISGNILHHKEFL